MSKRRYRSTDVKRVAVERLREAVSGVRVVVGVDIAKEAMVATVTDEGRDVLTTVKWSHPAETPRFVEMVRALGDAASEQRWTHGIEAVGPHSRQHGLATAGSACPSRRSVYPDPAPSASRLRRRRLLPGRGAPPSSIRVPARRR